jgi:L-fuconolactonase
MVATGMVATGARAIFDCHCHAWARWPYQPPVPDERARATVEQLIFEMDVNGVAQALVVCAAIDNNADNLDYVDEACRRHPGRLQMVADLDCTWSDTYHVPGGAARLEALCDRYPLVGLTHYLGDDNDGWLAGDDADAVFALAGERGLIISLGAAPAWQADLRRIAERHPGVPVLCHALGGIRVAPGRAEGLAQVLASSEVANIHIKLAGLHYCTPAGWDYPWSDVVSVLARVCDAYGPARLHWGSDFPASRRFCTYRQSLEVVRTHCAFLAAGDRQGVLGGNLRRALAGAGASRTPA